MVLDRVTDAYGSEAGAGAGASGGASGSGGASAGGGSGADTTWQKCMYHISSELFSVALPTSSPNLCVHIPPSMLYGRHCKPSSVCAEGTLTGLPTGTHGSTMKLLVMVYALYAELGYTSFATPYALRKRFRWSLGR
jgi:hypothetical protein